MFGFLDPLFNLLAIPLGWLMRLIYNVVPYYMPAIFLFTLLVRIVLFPLSLKTQKSQADRARLAPRLERIKKKYEKDPKKQQEKQMELYEKHGVSMTGGCMPMIVQMLVLFGIISVIYAPLKHIAGVPEVAVDAAVGVMQSEGLITEKDAKGYYGEMKMLKNLDNHEDAVLAAMKDQGIADADAAEYLAEMKNLKKDFMFFGKDLLENPWSGFGGISVLWLIPLTSGLTAFFSSLLSLHYTKQMTAAENQKAQGCSNVMMLIWMPAFSLFITFTVPGGVGIYWICSNLIALLQTYILNQIYNPAKIRAQAEIEYEERRRQKQEDKKRLAEARAKEQSEAAAQQKEGKKAPAKKKKATPANAEESPAESAEQPKPKDE